MRIGFQMTWSGNPHCSSIGQCSAEPAVFNRIGPICSTGFALTAEFEGPGIGGFAEDPRGAVKVGLDVFDDDT